MVCLFSLTHTDTHSARALPLLSVDKMYGTPLANYELLDATFKRILFTVLGMS